MDELIAALLIFRKYGNPTYPTYCNNEIMYIVGYDDVIFSDEDIATLKDIGFEYDENEECFCSYKFGD